MRPLVVTSGSLLAKTRPLDSQFRLLLLRQKQDVGAFERRSEGIIDQVSQILPTRRFWGRPPLALGLQSWKVIST
jgi:hypothetical protein